MEEIILKELIKNRSLDTCNDLVIWADISDLQPLAKKIKEAINYNQCCAELPIKQLPNCNRVEVIDQKGRSYVNWKPTNKVSISIQDNGKTAKIFID